MFRLMGHCAWRISGGKGVISEQDIIEGAKLTAEQMEKQVFDTPYTELSNADRAFLLAMLEDEKSILINQNLTLFLQSFIVAVA